MEDLDYRDRMSGQRYVKTLRMLHTVLQPKSYFEIGTLRGETLALAQCQSVAVDPKFQIASDIWGDKPSCHLFQQTSDAFFETYDLSSIFDGPVDMAFLDGMHLFEYLLRDFINTEAHCKENSLVILHDCVPPSLTTTSRKQHAPVVKQGLTPMLWAGDVFKVVPVLRKYRPDLQITITNCKPTGLVCITGLDPDNMVLKENYRAIVREFGGEALDRGAVTDFWASNDVMDHDDFNDVQRMMGQYWF